MKKLVIAGVLATCAPVFAAPAVINEQLMEGNVDAVLNFWHYNARLKAAGMNEVISVKDVLFFLK